MSHMCIILFAKIPLIRTLLAFNMSTSHLEVVDSAHSDARVLPYKYKFLQHVYILFEQLIPKIIDL
jgi:hypothetical protein